MQNKTRDKYSNKALSKGYKPFNDYKGNQGYIKTVKSPTAFTLLKWLVIGLVILFTTIHLLTKLS